MYGLAAAHRAGAATAAAAGFRAETAVCGVVRVTSAPQDEASMRVAAGHRAGASDVPGRYGEAANEGRRRRRSDANTPQTHQAASPQVRRPRLISLHRMHNARQLQRPASKYRRGL